MSYFLRLASLALIVSPLCFLSWANAEQRLEPDPSARSIASAFSHLPIALELLGEGERSLQAGTQPNYLALLQEYSVETPRGKINATFIYAVLDSKENAAIAFSSFPASIKAWRSENVVGDSTWGEYPRLTCFLQDRAVVYIHLQPHRDYNADNIDTLNSSIQPYMDMLVETVVSGPWSPFLSTRAGSVLALRQGKIGEDRL